MSEYSTSAVPTLELCGTGLTSLNVDGSFLTSGQPFCKSLQADAGWMPKSKSIGMPKIFVTAFGMILPEFIVDTNSTSDVAVLPRFKMHGGFLQKLSLPPKYTALGTNFPFPHDLTGVCAKIIGANKKITNRNFILMCSERLLRFYWLVLIRKSIRYTRSSWNQLCVKYFVIRLQNLLLNHMEWFTSFRWHQEWSLNNLSWLRNS